MSLNTYIEELVTSNVIEYGTLIGENVDGTARAIFGFSKLNTIYEKEVFIKPKVDGYVYIIINKEPILEGAERVDVRSLYDKIESLETKLKTLTLLIAEGVPKASSAVANYKVDKTDIVVESWKEFIILNPGIVDPNFEEGLENLLKPNGDLTEPEIVNKVMVQQWINKLKARHRIEAEVGDIYDLVADLSKRIAITERFTMRHFLDYIGDYEMTPTIKETYAYIMIPQITAVDSGNAIDRSDLQDPTIMIPELESRRTKIKDAVKEEMVDKE